MTNFSNSNAKQTELRRGGEKVDDPSVDNATPADGTTTLYQGQKIKLTVNTSNLATNNYDTIKFKIFEGPDFERLDVTKTGLIVHPDSIGNVTQTVTDSDDAYTINAVVFGTANSTHLGHCRWNIEVTGPAAQNLPVLELNGTRLGPSTDYGYGTKSVRANRLYGLRAIPGGVSDTFDENKAIKVSGFQIYDDKTKAPISAQFSACVQAKNGDLTYFDFWDANLQKLTKIKHNGVDSYVWIDSDANGKFTFYVTSNLTDDMYCDTLTMDIGDADPDIAEVIVGNPSDAGISSGLRAPSPDEAQGDLLKLESADTYVVASVPKLRIPNLVQRNDVLIPIVNGNLQLTSFFTADSDGWDAGFPACFSIPVAAFTGAADNIYELQYMVVRDNTIVMSSTAEYEVTGVGDPSGVIPPFTGSPRYLAPVMEDNPSGQLIDFAMVQDGVKVKISWAGAGWTPQANWVFTLYIIINGWDLNDKEVHSRTKVVLPAVSGTDLTNNFQEIDVGYEYFAGIIEGDPPSKLLMQYLVTDDGGIDQGYSTPTKQMHINTVPPGGA